MADIIRASKEALVVKPLELVDDLTRQHYYRNIAEGMGKKRYGFTLSFVATDATIQEVRDWLDVVQAVANEHGIEPSISGDYGVGIEAFFAKVEDYTEEERAAARQWLADHKVEPVHAERISWRAIDNMTPGYGLR